jgi:chloramphenicol O-acetyltransferase type A
MELTIYFWEGCMRTIDLETWPRREHYKLFRTFDHPHFNMCANVDLTAFYPALKQRGISLTVGIVYSISRAANAIPEFRHRIRGEEVVEHEIVHPSVTILVEDDLFSFCNIDYIDEFPEFAARATKMIAYVKEHSTLESNAEQDDRLYMTALPWVSFTSFTHPMQLHPADSIPRFAWGKLFKEGGILKMPLSVQGHHALMDGFHIGRYYQIVQEYFQQPENILGD